MKPRLQIVGLGAGGHAKVLLEMVRQCPDEWELVGLLDPATGKHGGDWGGARVLGPEELLPELARNGVRGFFVGVGSAGDLRARRSAFEAGLRAGLVPVTLVHRQSCVSPSAQLGRGVCVMAGAIINADAELGDNVCVNSGAIVEHDCHLAAHVFVAPGAALAGGVRVGERAFIGLRSVIKQGLEIGSAATVGAGAVVINHVRADTTVVGVPAKPLSRHDQA